MVRVFIKGGVWKNSEDEILKAAVMKYGKQQWARVASLLNRKSAKQCKARWNEWLDPSIKKLEDWSREEDEKLLHLAKLMPAQWRSIGPLVGNRTAQQCLERYERLLDQAAAVDEGGEATTTATAAVSSMQPLRPGDIDAHPETKPARPDPIDMDEDEMEMLQEARARLANTQGKKAKRKAREKMLSEAKRLADLQKRRELKQAGLLSSQARTKVRHRRDIDLGVEIPFYKPAPTATAQNDTTTEDIRAHQIQTKHLQKINYKQYNEQEYRTRDREQKKAQKKQEARLRQLERDNMQYVVAKVSQINDPIASRKRPALSLPVPAQQQQQQQQGMLPPSDSQSNNNNNSVTNVLLQDLGNRPLPTPMRTPLDKNNKNDGTSNSRQEAILREASQLRSIQQAQTPLWIGHKSHTQTDQQEDDATTATNHMSRAMVNATPGASTVADDGMSVTTAGTSIKELARQERRAAKRARLELEQALSNLPAPQFEYELSVPNEEQEEEIDDEVVKANTANNIHLVMDQEEQDALDLKEEIKKQKEKLGFQSSVIQRPHLPRPNNVNNVTIETPQNMSSSFSFAESLILEEQKRLLRYDTLKNPFTTNQTNDFNLKKSKKSKKRKQTNNSNDHSQVVTEVPVLEKLLNLQQAKDLLNEEYLKSTNQHNDVSEKEIGTFLFLPQRGWIANPTSKDQVDAYKAEFYSLQEQTAMLDKACKKLQTKLDTTLGGYQSKLKEENQKFESLQEKYHEEYVSKRVYANLHELEVAGLNKRIHSIQKEVEYLQECEAKGQRLYGDLVHEKKRLLLRIQQKAA